MHALVVWTFLSLAVTAAFGAVLFVGFTFRQPVTFLWFNLNDASYPRTLVMAHMASAMVTFLLFTWYLVRRGLGDAFVDAAYALTALTLGVGMAFFLRYDYWSRPLRWRLVGAHLVLAVFTFIAIVVALPLFPPPPRTVPRSDLGSHSSLWANVQQNLELELRNRLAHAHGGAHRSR
ncbi:MAG: hypothetical protein K6V73_00550 [Firmicutes bacterium]|nr:hypothetical protein [Bacillota bacterium]